MKMQYHDYPNRYHTSEQDTGTALHIHHTGMILISCLSQLFLTLFSLFTSPPITSTTSSTNVRLTHTWRKSYCIASAIQLRALINSSPSNAEWTWFSALKLNTVTLEAFSFGVEKQACRFFGSEELWCVYCNAFSHPLPSNHPLPCVRNSFLHPFVCFQAPR